MGSLWDYNNRMITFTKKTLLVAALLENNLWRILQHKLIDNIIRDPIEQPHYYYENRNSQIKVLCKTFRAQTLQVCKLKFNRIS
jgi:hypothetical protein